MGVKSKTAASWSSVKTKLRDFDRTALLGLLQDLYAASKDNQAFLHARLNLGGDPLAPYKAMISRFVCPDVFKNQSVSVAKAKKAISDYKKAIGYPEGMAELTSFYCEEVLVFLRSCWMEDEGYFLALLRMFEQALKWVMALPEAQQGPFLERLDRVRAEGQKIGWGVGDEMAEIWYTISDHSEAGG
ncbi:MAG: hypothetical protein ACLP7P_06795 [Rhodomicrobium sp.]